MGEVGILLSISRQYYRKKTDIEHEEMLKKAGFTSIAVYADRRFEDPGPEEQRIYLKARKGRIK